MLSVIGNKIKEGFNDFLPLGGCTVSTMFPAEWGEPDARRTQPLPDFISLLQSVGVNMVRIYLNMYLWKNEAGYPEHINNWVNRLADAGIYTYLCVHGDGIPGQYDNSEWERDVVWRDLAAREEVMLWMEELATRYSGQPYMAGICPMNEPGRWYAGGPGATELHNYWRNYLEEAIPRIHAVNPRYLIFVSGDGVEWGGYLTMFRGALLPYSNIVYSLHLYPDAHLREMPKEYICHEPNYVQSYVDGNFETGYSEMIEVMTCRAIDLNAPVIVQEYGICSEFANWKRLHWDLIVESLGKTYGRGFLQHCLHNFDAGKYAMLNPDWASLNVIGEQWASAIAELKPTPMPPPIPLWKVVTVILSLFGGGAAAYYGYKKLKRRG